MAHGRTYVTRGSIDACIDTLHELLRTDSRACSAPVTREADEQSCGIMPGGQPPAYVLIQWP